MELINSFKDTATSLIGKKANIESMIGNIEDDVKAIEARVNTELNPKIDRLNRKLNSKHMQKIETSIEKINVHLENIDSITKSLEE